MIYEVPEWAEAVHKRVVRWAVYRPHPDAPFSVPRRHVLAAWLWIFARLLR